VGGLQDSRDMRAGDAAPMVGVEDNGAERVLAKPVGRQARVAEHGTGPALERKRPGQTVDELSRAVFAELAMKRSRRAAELVAEAIRIARARKPRPEITGSR
jgi:hypothetical protein